MGVYCDPMMIMIPVLIGAACWIIDITDAIGHAIKRYIEEAKKEA